MNILIVLSGLALIAGSFCMSDAVQAIVSLVFGIGFVLSGLTKRGSAG